jgi:uncharacterized protein YdhG (YjbR/CyaY superfamily)
MEKEIKTNFKNVDEYIALQSEKIKITLEILRKTIRKAAPEATEIISYQMPAFRFQGMLAYFAVFKNHYSLFVNPKVLEAFKDKLSEYTLSKSAIRIPLDKPVPEKLVTEIIQFAAKENIRKKLLKEAIKVNRPKTSLRDF